MLVITYGSTSANQIFLDTSWRNDWPAHLELHLVSAEALLEYLQRQGQDRLLPLPCTPCLAVPVAAGCYLGECKLLGV